MIGRYVQEALSAVLSAMFGKRGHSPYKYPTQPYSFQEAAQAPKDEEYEVLRAKIYMRQMMRAGKNWGTQQKGR